MAQLRQDYQEFLNRQSQVVVVGPDDAKAFEAYWRQNDLPFIGLPDPEFSLPSFQGEMVRLSDYRGKSNVLLVFNRGFA